MKTTNEILNDLISSGAITEGGKKLLLEAINREYELKKDLAAPVKVLLKRECLYLMDKTGNCFTNREKLAQEFTISEARSLIFADNKLKIEIIN
jgi:hypothetical protein